MLKQNKYGLVGCTSGFKSIGETRAITRWCDLD